MGERGATAVEYGLIVALIAVSATAAMGDVGDRLIVIITDVANALAASIGGGTGGPPAP
jgi:pilus assembly protein Flp/PilA